MGVNVIRRWTVVVGAVLLLTIGLFGWPTPYRYDDVSLRGRRVLVRTQRLTGNVEMLTSFGWLSPQNAQATTAQAGEPARPCTVAEEKKLHEDPFEVLFNNCTPQPR